MQELDEINISLNIDELNMHNICRACLCSKQLLKEIFNVCSAEVFRYCTSVEISQKESFPQLICMSCLDLLKNIYCFKQMVIKSNTILKQQTTLRIKQESYRKDTLADEKVSHNVDPNVANHYFSEKELGVELSCNINLANVKNNQDVGASILVDKSVSGSSIPEDPNDGKVKEEKSYRFTNIDVHDSQDFDDAVAVASDSGEEKLQSNKSKCSKEKMSAKRKKKQTEKLYCPKCDKCFHKYENLEAHMRRHFGKKPDIQCTECKKRFSTINNLNSHMYVHTGIKKYQCTICGKQYGNSNILKKHEKIHSGVKKYECHKCNVKFVQACNLTTHLKLHSGEKKYECKHCGKKFIQQGYLTTHVKRHTNKKKFACPKCDMKFFVKWDLGKHMRSHSDEKPYSCNLCEKTFKTKSFLAVHARTHTGERPYSCEFCPMKFRTRNDLKNHRMTHTGEKPHKCKLCCQAFIQKCALNRHMKTHNKLPSSA